MLRRSLLLGFVAGAVCLASAGAYADDASGLASCPGYRAALLDARGALTRGDRSEALAALERAKAALVKCNREEAHGGRTVRG